MEGGREGAPRNGNLSLTLCPGYPVTCQEDVSLCVGPVMGEVTHNKAVILMEVKSDLRSRMEVSCDLYKKGDFTRQYRQSLRLTSRAPTAFVFQEETGLSLEPDTEYVAVFNGLNIYQAGRAFALFRTKPEAIRTFRIIAFSCDRPDRMFLGKEWASENNCIFISVNFGYEIFLFWGVFGKKKSQVFFSTNPLA